MLLSNQFGRAIVLVALVLIAMRPAAAQSVNVSGKTFLKDGLPDKLNYSGSTTTPKGPTRNYYRNSTNSWNYMLAYDEKEKQWILASYSKDDSGYASKFYIIATSSVASYPNPPTTDNNFGNWQGASSSNNISSLTGDGTQDFLGVKPAINAGPATGSATACVGTSSTAQSFVVSGTGLWDDVTVSSPNNFEISTDATSGFGSSIVLPMSGGSVSSKTIYARTTASAPVGNPTTGNVMLTSAGADDQTVSMSAAVNPLPMPAVGLQDAFCKDASAVPLTGTPTGGRFTIDATMATVFNPANLSVGQHTVVYSYTNSSGCTNSATQTVTVKAIPQIPVITTQNGHSYPAGVSSLILSQDVGDVVLAVSGCSDGTITWAGGKNTTLVVSTFDTGVQTFTATCTQNGCVSPLATATLTVVPATLSVFHRDGNGQVNTNNLQPFIQLQNDGSKPIPYSEITVRYWLTVENPAPLQFKTDYAQIGSDKVHLKYVPMSTANPGATGYIEFSFDAPAGNLAANANSGPIQSQVNKQNYSNFNQADDYSYISTGNFIPNSHITAYRNGVIFWGQEPGPVVPTRRLQAYLQSNAGPDANSIAPVLQVNNTGNVAVNYGDLKVRYYFTADGPQPLVSNQVGYVALGGGNVMAQVVRMTTPLTNADTYLELSFKPSLGVLAPGANTGTIAYELRKSDYSSFNQRNDYSYFGTGGQALNTHVVVFVAGVRAFGTEPVAATRVSAEEGDTSLQVRVLGNPVGSELTVEVQGAAGQPLTLQVTDLTGRVVNERRIEQAGILEQLHFSLGHQPAGLLLLQVSSPTQSKTVKVIKVD